MLRDIRTDYQKYELDDNSVIRNPFDQLLFWLEEAVNEKVQEPTAMILSTIDQEGNPESRVVLLKEIKAEGLVFYTNYESKKGQQINVNSHVSIVFFWPELERQVRIKGSAEKISEEESNLYFLSRPIDSQLGAWASPQSQVIEKRQVLNHNFAHFKQHFETHEIKKPPHWGGFLICPEYFEFWQGRSNRLHDRIEFVRTGNLWNIHRLAP
jgi:pyridoxamine 5'-phosphate oxidase